MTTRWAKDGNFARSRNPGFRYRSIRDTLATPLPERFAVANPLPDGIPSLEQTPYSRESLVDGLRNASALPAAEIAVATLYADAIEADVVAVLLRAQHEDLDVPSGRLLFRGIHILGGRRLAAAYRPLVAFLSGPQDRVETLLGDAVTENLSQILAGLFDGDEQPLRELVADASVDPFVREAALRALAFLAFDSRIDRATFEAFLRHFGEDKLAAADDDVMWHAWMTAVAVLGLTKLEPRVRKAFADGRIPPHWCDEDDFVALLNAAIERPNDHARLEGESMGYIDDVIEALEKFATGDDDFGDTGDDFGADSDELEDLRERLATTLPTQNPYRHVGRNDPCPCGSGKKFKKCCGKSA
jgi:hypothetical protein